MDMDSRGNILYLVVPCYNEEEGLEHAARVMRDKVRRLVAEGQISGKSKIMFVNDGSRDGTCVQRTRCFAAFAFPGITDTRAQSCPGCWKRRNMRIWQ